MSTGGLTVEGYERALADLFGGFDGGWALWRAALASLELAVERSRDAEGRFTSFPAGEMRRLLRDVEGAVALAATAADLQRLLNGGEDAQGRSARDELSVSTVLVDRVRELARSRADRP